MPGAAKVPRQKKREIDYLLDYRGGAVFLVQRPHNARLMAGMWELPQADAPSGAKAQSNGAGKIAALKAPRHPKAKRAPTPEACITLRHSITLTDYTVRVWRMPVPEQAAGKWIPVEKLSRVALTGLARKILRKAEIMAAHPTSVGPTDLE